LAWPYCKNFIRTCDLDLKLKLCMISILYNKCCKVGVTRKSKPSEEMKETIIITRVQGVEVWGWWKLTSFPHPLPLDPGVTSEQIFSQNTTLQKIHNWKCKQTIFDKCLLQTEHKKAILDVYAMSASTQIFGHPCN